jgi:plasmid stabilization system protein ParE
MRVHEHGVFARFRYNDLKEAARFAADAGPMQIQWWEGAASSCAGAVLQSARRDCRRPEAGRMRKKIVSSVVEELEKEVRSVGRHRGTERVEKHVRIGESRFMPQP